MARLILASLLFLPALASTAAAQDSAARAQLVVDIASGAEDAGGDSAHPVTNADGDLARGRSRELAVSLAASKCYVAVARGAGIENVDVAFVRGRTVLARDTDTGVSAIVRYCAGATAERVSVRVTAYRGQGAYAVGVYEQRAVAASGDAHPTAGGAPSASVLDQLAALSRAQTGYTTTSAATRETLLEGQTVERTLNVTPGRCYRVLVATDPGVTDVDLALFAPGDTGGEVQRDATQRPDASLGVLRPLCPGTPGPHRLRITLARGQGAVAWQALTNQTSAGGGSANAPVTHFAIGGTDFLGTRVRARATQLAAQGTAVHELARATLQTSQEHDVTADMLGGRCYVAVAAGAASVRELTLVVHDSLGNELAHSTERDAAPSARFCAQIAGRARVTVRPVVGYGQIAVQVIQLTP